MANVISNDNFLKYNLNTGQKELKCQQLAIKTSGVCTQKNMGVNNFVGTYVIVSVYDVGGVRGWQTFPPGLEWT